MNDFDHAENDSRPIILLVGLGSIGQRHARNLRTLLGDRVRLLAYRVRGASPLVGENMQADTARRPEDVLGIETVDSLDAALARRPRVAYICNPTSHHVEVAAKCAATGCDLFIEKPVSHSLDGIEDLQRLIDERGSIVGVSSQLRFHPVLGRVRTILQSGALGRPLAVRAEVGEYLPGFHPYEDYRTSYAARKALGGGVVLTLIHDVDYLTWLFGIPATLYAVGGQLSSLDLDVEDVASVLMDCRLGESAIPVHLQMDYVRRPPRRRCGILCDGGWAELDLRSQRLDVANANGDIVETVDVDGLDRNNLFLAQMKDFLDACRTRRPPAVTLTDGVSSLRVAVAIHRSLATKSLVPV